MVQIEIERKSKMPLQTSDQVRLLADLLQNQQTDCCGSNQECEQMERLVQSLLSNPNTAQEMKSILEDISVYSKSGSTTQELDQHITSYQSNLGDWASQLNNHYKL